MSVKSVILCYKHSMSKDEHNNGHCYNLVKLVHDAIKPPLKL